MNAADFATRSAARRGISQMLGRQCVARRPHPVAAGTVTCAGRLDGGAYYCRDCHARLKRQDPAEELAVPHVEGPAVTETPPDTSPSDT